VKALTMTQPWAMLVALGENSIETRSWSTKYRGALAIHSAKAFPKEARALCEQEPYEHEADFGDFSAGRYGFVLSHVRRLSTPVPARGLLGVWDVPPALKRSLVRKARSMP